MHGIICGCVLSKIIDVLDTKILGVYDAIKDGVNKPCILIKCKVSIKIVDKVSNRWNVLSNFVMYLIFFIKATAYDAS